MAVIDADAHVVETERTWDYLDPGDQKYRPVLSSGNSGREQWIIDGKPGGFRFPTLSERDLAARSKLAGRNVVTAQADREMDDIELRLDHMDELGIDVQILHNTLFINPVTDNPAVEVALCRAYNRWLGDIWRKGNGRLRWSAMAPALSVPDAVDEVRFARQNGAVAVLMRPIEEGDRLLTDPYFYPIYEEAARLDMCIAVHIANGSPKLLDIYRSAHHQSGGFTSFRTPTVLSCQQLIRSTVPQDFPTLRWGFIEASAQWVPWVVSDVKERFQVEGKRVPEYPLEENRIYVTCQNNDDLPFVLKHAGEHSIVIGTDYGHTDPSSDLDAIKVLRESSLPAATRTNILENNPAALYGL